MKRIVFEYIPAWILLVIMGLIVIHAPLTVYASSHWPEVGLYIKAWKELLMVVAGILIAASYVVTRQWRAVVRDKLLWLASGFVLLHLVTAVFSSTSLGSIIAGLMIDLRYVVYFVLVYLYLRQYPAYRAPFLRVGLIGACIVAGFVLLQLLLPHDFLKYLGYGPATIEPYLTVDKNPDFIRYSSTLRGPNPLGAYMIMVCAGVVAYLLAHSKKSLERYEAGLLALLGLGGVVGLWVSYSRSAAIGALVAIALVVFARFRHKLTHRAWLIAGVLAIVATGVLYLARDTSFVNNVILHNNPTTGAAVDSNQGHLDSLQDGVSRMARQPLGAGVGSTGSASLLGDRPLVVENQFLFVAHEAGWLGLGLFEALAVAVVVRLWQRRSDWRALTLAASGVGLLIVGLLLPVWTDDTVSIVWWGLAAAILATEGVRHARTTNKKAKRTT